MRMIVEQLVEWSLAGETEVLGENLPQLHFVHHKSHMTRPGLEPRAAAVGSQRLTAWAMARPHQSHTLKNVIVKCVKLNSASPRRTRDVMIRQVAVWNVCSQCTL
jgi:hypothetical protein